MSQHPTPEILAALLKGGLPEARRRSVLAHLAGGCETCCAEMEPELSILINVGQIPDAPSAEDYAAYDRHISAAIDKALASARDLPRERHEVRKQVGLLLSDRRRFHDLPKTWQRRLTSWAACEVLLEESFSLRYDEPQAMVYLAELAVAAASLLGASSIGAENLADLRARAWAELGNAYRVAEVLDRSERAFEHASEQQQQGTGAPLLHARICELAAETCGARRAFGEAFRLLDAAFKIYEGEGDPHLAGRALIEKGLYAGYDNDPEEAIRLISQGLKMTEHGRDPKLVFIALHNLIWFKIDLGQFRDARMCILDCQPLYLAEAGRLDRIKLRWAEGRIAAGLGELEKAERALLQARESMEEADLPFKAAMVGLDLAAVWLRQGKRQEVYSLISDLVAAFRRVGVEREALAALLMLREAMETDALSMGMLKTVADALKRLDWAPARGTGPAGPRYDPAG